MATVNILEKWKEGILAGTPGYSTDDASQAFIDAWDEGHISLFLPQVPSAAIATDCSLLGYYPVADLDPPDGCIIRCESTASQVRGVDPDQTIFRTSTSKWRIQIIGGTWTAAAAVWKHVGVEDENGEDELVPILRLCRFEGMRITGVDVGFYLNGAFRTTWRDLEVRGVGSGMELDIDQFYLNDNHVDNCLFQNCNSGSIAFTGTGRKYHFTISRCLFQNPGAPSNRPAIFVSDNARSLTIQECFFEDIGAADIELVSLTRPLRSIMIRGCRFSTSPLERWRIRNSGRASYVAEDNLVRLRNNQVFARCEGFASADFDFTVWLFRNCIHYTGTDDPFPDYVSLLFADEGLQSVEFTENRASQNVSFP